MLCNPQMKFYHVTIKDIRYITNPQMQYHHVIAVLNIPHSNVMTQDIRHATASYSNVTIIVFVRLHNLRMQFHHATIIVLVTLHNQRMQFHHETINYIRHDT